MDLQYYGANCITITNKGTRIVIDDNLKQLGSKSIITPNDVALFTNEDHLNTSARLVFDGPGEYEVADISIVGIPARGHMDESASQTSVTMYKIIIGETSLLITGHIHPDIKENILEKIGLVDILIVPIGGSGYTLDPIGALKVIKEIEPKRIIPTHYSQPGINYPVPQTSLEDALKDLAMEVRDTLTKLRIKPADTFEGSMQLLILEKS